MTWRTFLVVPAAGLLLVAGCTSGGDDPPDGVFHDPALPAGEVRLVTFDSCDDAARLLPSAASDHVGPWGFSGGGPGLAAPGFDGDVAEDGARAPAAQAPEAAQEEAPAPADPQPPEAYEAEPEHSGTNVHEDGVDEPDIVKTDGDRIVTVSQGRLRVVDAAGRVETGAMDLPESGAVAADLLLHGDRALVLVTQPYGWTEPARPAVPDQAPAEPDQGSEPDQGAAEPDQAAEPESDPGPEETPIGGPKLLLVDLAGDPRVVSEYTVDGGLVDARAVGPTARVVVRSSPRIDFPELDGDATEQERLEANRAAVEQADLSAWLPRYEVTTGGTTSTGQVDCAAVSRPATYTATSMLTVLTFDLAAAELSDGAPASVVADGDTVYSNGSSLYVTSDRRWAVPVVDDAEEEPPEIDERTEIHQFDTSATGPPRYVASGAVDGWLVNQYAMSEWDGHLRVATTSGEAPGEQDGTESTVYVLAQRDGALVEVGSVGGLGKGERIYSVRFAGPIGYVVTFRETDPLYTVDLADPAAPVLLGELKITGYSAYLHSIGDDDLIGVGQEADLDGVIQGTQVSLFDVSDLADPQVRAQHHVEQARSSAEFDPHAFLWWQPEALLVIPLTDYERGSTALLLRVDGDGLTELDRISHPGTGTQILRSLVVGDALWTLSDAGLAAHDLSTLEQLDWLPF